jgi:Sulfotransferase family
MSTTSALKKPLLTHDQAEDILCGKKLVFLVGSPRSGTTWLQLLLSRSPAIATVPETQLFSRYMHSMVEQWNDDRITARPIGLTKLLGDEEFRGLLRSTTAVVFGKIAQSKPSATVVLEKTPGHVRCSHEILELWPDAHFIHIIRDPRSVVASLRAASRSWASDWASPRAWKNCERWIVDVSTGRQIRSATPNYHEVTYEELSVGGPDVMMRILAGLGVPSSLNECKRYIDECDIENLKRLPVPRGFFRLGKTDSWEVELSTWEIALVELLAGPLMSELGFKPVNGSKAMAALVGMACTSKDAARVVKRWLRNFLERRQWLGYSKHSDK